MRACTRATIKNRGDKNPDPVANVFLVIINTAGTKDFLEG